MYNKVMFTSKMFNLLMLHNEIDVINPVQPDTVYGISKHIHPEIYRRILNVINIAPEDANQLAISFYYNTHFKPLKCDYLYSESLALNLLDIAYNLGNDTAISLLQMSLNIIFDKKVVDINGSIGDITLHNLNKIDQNELNNILVNVRKDYTNKMLASRPMNNQLIAKMNVRADRFLH